MQFIKQDITTAPEKYIVHGCNCQATMGSGVAKAIRSRWPHVYETYRRSPQVPGSYCIVPIREGYVANCFTQVRYGRDGRAYAELGLIDSALGLLAGAIARSGDSARDVAIVPIGCGLGGLKWEDVGPIVAKHLPEAKVYKID